MKLSPVKKWAIVLLGFLCLGATVTLTDLQGLTSLADGDLFLATDISETATEKSKKVTAKVLANYVVPVGTVSAYAGSTAPFGYLECDGAAVSRSTYADLFAVLGEIYGEGDASTTFNVPDYRGYFLRGYDHGAGIDPDAATRTDRGDGTVGDNIGTVQEDEFESHTHRVTRRSNTDSNKSITKEGTSQSFDTDATIIEATGGNETRPKNKTVMWIVKY